MRRVLVVITLLAAVATTPVAAQNVVTLAADLSIDTSFIVVEPSSVASFTIVVTDRSNDGTGAHPEAPPNGLPHSIDWDVVPLEEKRGWVVQEPTGGTTLSGETKEYEFRVITDPTAQEPYYEFTVVFTMRGQFAEPTQRNITMTAYTPGLDVFNVQASGAFQTSPGDFAEVSVSVTNVGIYPRAFDFSLAENPCNLDIEAPTTLIVAGKATEELAVGLRAPTQKFWYNSETCGVSMIVAPQDNPAQAQNVFLSGQVSGFYVNPLWVFWSLAILTAAAILFFFLHRRKQIIEEEILGKPQKPWTIPTERVYLEHLEAKDPRAAYVVRHFLMEEEYQSALLWYRNYKRATRGERAKESLVVGQERKYERFRRGWEKRIAAPLVEADRFDAKLQRQLDRQAKRDVRKQRRAWKKIVAKLEQATEAQNAKATAKWEKAAAKAEKKGRPAPPKPTPLVPDLPPEPQLQKIQLAEHKLAKKAAKFRKKMVKRQGDLEVKFEKKDARMLHKLRRKVQRIARKLDDPDFVNEHPLLTRSSS